MQTLTEFTNDLKNQIDEFIKYWESSQKESGNKTLWPDKMNLSEWQEQFLAYFEMQEK